MSRDDFNTHTENFDKGQVQVLPVIVCRENRSEYRYENKSRHHVAKIKIDGGLIPNQNTLKKCDWLLINWDNRVSYFVELKGSDLPRAIQQIKCTLEFLLPDLQRDQMNAFEARIVLTKASAPKILNSPELRKLAKRIRIKIGSQKLTDTV